MIDDPTRPDLPPEVLASTAPAAAAANQATRRGFLKVAGTVAAGAAAASVGCAPAGRNEGETGDAAAAGLRSTGVRSVGFDRPLLDALGEVVLPTSLGAASRGAAVAAFVAWVDGYDPVAEEMHGYGYSDVRYLPPDPAPGWRAQLEGLDLLARKMHQKPFAQLDAESRQSVVTAALAPVAGSGLSDPLGASHIAVALMSHWAASPGAWDLALGARVGTGTCRSLDGVTSRPLPIVGVA